MFSLLGRGVSSLASLLQSVANSGGSASTSTTDKQEEAKHVGPTTVLPEQSSRLSDFLRSVEQKTAQPLVVLKIPTTQAAAVSSETSSPVTEPQPEPVFDETSDEGEMGRRNYLGAGTSQRPSRNREQTRKLTPAEEPGDIVEGTGVVTVLEDCMSKGLIDGQYFFDKASCAPDIKRGSVVIFQAKKTESSTQWIVQFLKLHVSLKELEKRDLRKTKTFVGKITNIRDGVVALLYGKTSEEIQEIPLPAVLQALQYQPWLGDYLRVKIETDDPDAEAGSVGRILSVEPTQRKTVVGRLTQNNRGVVSIENYIYFNQSVCLNKRLPSLHDCVCAVAVESSQEQFQWRAVSVAPSNFHIYTSSTRESEGWLGAENTWSGPLLELQNDKFGVNIQPRKFVTYGTVKIGSSLTKTVEINNSSDVAVSLRSVTVNGDQSVCVFRAAFETQEAPDIIATIQPGGSFSCRVSCSPAMLGSTRELLLFNFGNFRIGRYLTVTALSSEVDILNEIDVKDVTNGKGREWRQVRCEDAVSKIIDESKRQVVRGIQPVRTAFFLSKRLEMNTVPKYLWTILKDKDEEALIRRHPGIPQALNIENYLEKFQVALWLEEMENDILRRQYDMDKVILRRAGEYYIFEVPGLKDFHPPVLMGDPISVYDSADISNQKYEAFVCEMKGNYIYAKFNEQFRIKYDGTYVTVEFRLGRTTYKRCHHAISQAIKYLEEDWLFPTVGIPIKPARIMFLEEDEETPSDADTSQTGSETIGKQESAAPVAQEPVPPPVRFLNLFPKRNSGNGASAQSFHASGRSLNRRVGSMKEAFVSDTQGPNLHAGNMKLEWFNTKLNQEQKDAVRRVLRGQGRPTPYIIFGPPGTGKTVTVVEAILQVYTLDKNSRVLVVAPSNSAADVIAIHLAASKEFIPGDFVRLVGFLRLDAQIPESIRNFCNDGENLDTIARHRLIICTCTTAGQFFQLGLDTGHFTHVFIDEAGYCTEPEALIASTLVALSKSGQIILAGDPKQLGPVLMSDVASKCGLTLSFLERLMSLPLYSRDEVKFPKEKYNPLALTKLVKNYRAHPTLLKLPSKLFYDDELVSAAAEEDVNLCYSLSFTKAKGVPLVFHGIQGTSSRDPDSPSWFNAAEVIEVVNYVRKLRAHGLTNDDIGIITPYRKQVEKLRRALELGLLQDEIPKVGSVEEFQGGERKVMIMSLVRSVAEERLEKVIDRLSFVFSPKRFNVGVTRAKALLIVIGNPHVLHHDPNWSTFLKYCIELDCYTGCHLPLDLDPKTKSVLNNLESDAGPELPHVSE